MQVEIQTKHKKLEIETTTISRCWAVGQTQKPRPNSAQEVSRTITDGYTALWAKTRNSPLRVRTPETKHAPLRVRLTPELSTTKLNQQTKCAERVISNSTTISGTWAVGQTHISQQKSAQELYRTITNTCAGFWAITRNSLLRVRHCPKVIDEKEIKKLNTKRNTNKKQITIN